jgi:hypothetical protein
MGALNSVEGCFEWIVDSGNVTHRLFGLLGGLFVFRRLVDVERMFY